MDSPTYLGSHFHSHFPYTLRPPIPTISSLLTDPPLFHSTHTRPSQCHGLGLSNPNTSLCPNPNSSLRPTPSTHTLTLTEHPPITVTPPLPFHTLIPISSATPPIQPIPTATQSTLFPRFNALPIEGIGGGRKCMMRGLSTLGVRLMRKCTHTLLRASTTRWHLKIAKS